MTSWNSCDANTGWAYSEGGTVGIDSTTKYQGTGSIKLKKTATVLAYSGTSKTDMTSISISTTVGCITVKLYIVDQATKDKLGSEFLYIGSSADNSNSGYWVWSPASIPVATWTTLVFPWANRTGNFGTPNAAALIFFSLYVGVTTAATTYTEGSILMDDIQYGTPTTLKIGGTSLYQIAKAGGKVNTSLGKVGSVTVF